MSKTPAKDFSDFWGFLQDKIADLNEEAAKVQSDSDMKKLLDRWLHPKDGVLARLAHDPTFAMTRPNAQEVFMDTMKTRVYQVEREWREIWRSFQDV